MFEPRNRPCIAYNINSKYGVISGDCRDSQHAGDPRKAIRFILPRAKFKINFMLLKQKNNRKKHDLNNKKGSATTRFYLYQSKVWNLKV